MKSVVVTGAAGGVGSATARTFAAAGWRVIGLDRAPLPSDVAVDHFEMLDMGDADSVRRTFGRLVAEEPLDALVNNAAISLDKGLLDINLDDWERIMAVNVRAALLTIQHCVPRLTERQGAVVNVSSVHAVATSTRVAAYAASKGALLALTRAAAVELAEHRVRVNAVLPGAVDTPMLRAGVRRRVDKGYEAEELDALARRTPLGRIGDPAEIADAILFLADRDRSSFVTGQALIIDGGATARLSTE